MTRRVVVVSPADRVRGLLWDLFLLVGGSLIGLALVVAFGAHR